MLMSVERIGKYRLEPGQGVLQCCHIVLCKNKSLNKPTGVLEHCREEETNCSPSVGTFPSYPVPKATKDVHIHYFIHNSISCKLCQRIPGTF